MDRGTSTNDQQEQKMLPLTASNGTSGATIPIGHGRNTNNPHSRDSRVKALNAYQEVENATIDDMLIRKVAAAKAGTTIGRGDRTAALVDALSSSLASFARTADDVEDEAAANADSSSTSGDNHASDRDSSTANGSGSRHVVTATQTTSSGDDRDSGTASGGGISGGITSEYSAPGSQRELISRHHHHHRFRRRVPTNDGSALQVPGDDGSDRLAGGPATVVASRLYPRNSDTTTNTSSSGSGGEGEAQDSLLQPHREPGYHTIRRTFSKLPKRDVRREPKSSATDSSSTEEGITKKVKGKHGLPKPASDVAPKAKKKKPSPRAEDPKARARGRGSPSPDSVNSNPPDGGGGGSLSGSGTEGGSSSGSGTEGGYAGDAQQESCSSPSVSSSEESRRKSKSKRHRTLKEDGQHKSSKQEGHGSGNSSSSSELADFSSGSNSDDGEEAGGFTINVSPSTSPSLSSSSNDLEETYIRVKRAASVERKRVAVVAEAESWTRHRMSAAAPATKVIPAPWPRTRIRVDVKSKLDGRTPILNVGCDIMAHVLTFLQPPEILNVLTMPLSKVWRQNFTCQAELWRVLCLVEPFKAKIADEDADDSSSADSFYNPAQNEDYFDRRLLDRYRLLYTSFVRCMNYLSQIREDAINGRTPSYIDYGGNGDTQSLVGTNKSLQSFLARARGVVSKSKRGTESSECSDISEQEQEQKPMANTLTVIRTKGKRKHSGKSKKNKRAKIGFGTSMVTDRLLKPSPTGQTGNLNLPWSCAIYSIVNWMVAFLDVEGIQTLCMKVLPFLLEDEQQRMTAQRAGLTDVVLRGMVLFPNSVQLHIAAFHTIVLLARPLGGREGMLFHSSMVASGIFGGDNSQHRKNGIAVMLDSMRRFEDNDVLQAMSCWALVNIALAPAQKAILVKLGGIQATTNAMLCHPFSAEVQFRALFALINLVIPSVRLNDDSPEAVAMQQQLGDVNDTTEKEIIDDLVSDIASLVVRALKNFCSSEAILNRACLVLHNLSLTREYHTTLLWTPNCYQMLEWCLANYPTDQVLQQSATGTLHRLQMTLSNDDDLRNRFAESLQAQQQTSLEQAHREAIRLHEQQEELHRQQELQKA